MIACHHCGAWMIEPRYTLPVAAALMPASVDALKASLRRYRNRLPEPQYRRLGARWIRLVSVTELQVLRSIQTVQLYRRAHNLRPMRGA
jgi:hypothetical protein